MPTPPHARRRDHLNYLRWYHFDNSNTKHVHVHSGVEGLKFLPQLWSNLDKKWTKTRFVHTLKLGFIALNDCCWINWPSWVEKMFKTNKFCRNLFDIRNSYPNRVGVSWASPTPLHVHVHQSFWQNYGGVPLVKVCEVDGGTPNTMPLNVDSKLNPNSGVGVELILRPLTSQPAYTWLYVSIRWIMCQVDSNISLVSLWFNHCNENLSLFLREETKHTLSMPII